MKSKLLSLTSAIFLNLVAFSVIAFINFQIMSVGISSLRYAYSPFVETILSMTSFPPFLYSVTFLAHLVAAVVITKRFTHVKKDILIVYGLQFLIIAAFLFISAYPGFRELGTCQDELRRERDGRGYMSGDCATYLENSRALIILPMFAIYVSIFSSVAAVLNMSLLGRKSYTVGSIVRSKRILMIIAPILLFTLPYVLFPKRSAIQLYQLPETTTTRTFNASLQISPMIKNETLLPPNMVQQKIKDVVCHGYKSSEDFSFTAYLKFETINSKQITNSENVCDPYVNNLSLFVEKNDESHEIVTHVEGAKQIISFEWNKDNSIEYKYRCGNECEKTDTLTIF